MARVDPADEHTYTAIMKPPELAISELLAGGDLAGAVTLVVRTYGPEIYSYLHAVHRDTSDSDEVFSLFTEALWHSLRDRELRCSHRTWAYAVARRSSLRYRRAERRRSARFAPWPDNTDLSRLAVAERTETALCLQTAKRNRFAELRATLSEADQTLLMLRVDRGLSWNDLVAVLGASGATPHSAELIRRDSARLRKRFEVLKKKLQVMAEEAGLVPRTGDAI